VQKYNVSSVGFPDPHVLGHPDPSLTGTDPDPSFFSQKYVERTEIMLEIKL
jgi:hypothetical protein